MVGVVGATLLVCVNVWETQKDVPSMHSIAVLSLALLPCHLSHHVGAQQVVVLWFRLGFPGGVAWSRRGQGEGNEGHTGMKFCLPPPTQRNPTAHTSG